MKKILLIYALVFLSIVITSCTSYKATSSLIANSNALNGAPSSISLENSNSQSASENFLPNVASCDSSEWDVSDKKNVPIDYPDIQGKVLTVNLKECEFTINSIDNYSDDEFGMVILSNNEVVIKYDEYTHFVYTTSNDSAKTTQTVLGNIDNVKIGLHAKIKGKFQNGNWFASEIEIAQSIS